MATHISAPKPDLGAKAKTKHNVQAFCKKECSKQNDQHHKITKNSSWQPWRSHSLHCNLRNTGGKNNGTTHKRSTKEQWCSHSTAICKRLQNTQKLHAQPAHYQGTLVFKSPPLHNENISTRAIFWAMATAPQIRTDGKGPCHHSQIATAPQPQHANSKNIERASCD